MSNELSPEQRDLLTRLFASELAALRDAAAEAGAASGVTDGIADARREALQQRADRSPEETQAGDD